MFKNVNGLVVPMTQQEISDRESEIAENSVVTVDQVSARRYAEEIKGTLVFGIQFSTTRDSRANLAAAYSFATAEQDFTVNWKTPDGAFITLNAAQIREAALAVASHVQACYTREAELVASIKAGTYQNGSINTGWPGYDH